MGRGYPHWWNCFSVPMVVLKRNVYVSIRVNKYRYNQVQCISPAIYPCFTVSIIFYKWLSIDCCCIQIVLFSLVLLSADISSRHVRVFVQGTWAKMQTGWLGVETGRELRDGGVRIKDVLECLDKRRRILSDKVGPGIFVLLFFAQGVQHRLIVLGLSMLYSEVWPKRPLTDPIKPGLGRELS